MSLLTPEQSSRIAVLRSKFADGSATEDDMKEVITILRAGRFSAASSAPTAKRAAAKAAIPNADDLLAELK